MLQVMGNNGASHYEPVGVKTKLKVLDGNNRTKG